MVTVKAGWTRVTVAVAVLGVRADPLRLAPPVAVFMKEPAVTLAAVVARVAWQVIDAPAARLAGRGRQSRALMPASASVTLGLARATSPVLVRTIV